MKCKNCGHEIVKLSYQYKHVSPNKDVEGFNSLLSDECKVLGCNCSNPEPA